MTDTAITLLFSQLELSDWPEILSQLLNIVESNNSDIARESTMGALSKICKDSFGLFKYQEQCLFDYMIPKFLKYMALDNQNIRACSVAYINEFIQVELQSFFIPYVNTFFNIISL